MLTDGDIANRKLCRETVSSQLAVLSQLVIFDENDQILYDCEHGVRLNNSIAVILDFGI
jgi:hypothetical protein